LKLPYREGDLLSARYLYDEATGKQGTYGMLGAGSAEAAGLRINLMPGTGAYLGLGLTERRGDGTVLTSNVYGLGNSLSLAPGLKFNSLVLVGERQSNRSMDLMSGSVNQAGEQEGTGQAFIQGLSGGFMGGDIDLYYQAIDENFSGVSAARSFGYTDEQAAAMDREKGLKRTRFNLQNAAFGDARLSARMETVGDAQGAITERGYGLAFGGFKTDWWSRSTDAGFVKFQNLGDNEWRQLSKERDLTREGLKLGYDFAGGKAFFESLAVEAPKGGLLRANAGIEAGGWKFNHSEQRVDAGFDRGRDLRGNEFNPNQIAQESGILRRTTGIEGKGLGLRQFKLELGEIRTEQADLDTWQLAAAGGRWSIAHESVNVGEGFNRFGSLQPDINGLATRMLSITDSSAKVQGHDPRAVFQAAGIDRSVWRLGYDLGAKSGLRAERQTINLGDKGFQADRIRFESEKVQASFLNESNDSGVDLARRLMTSEQQRLSVADGLNRMQFSLAAQLDANSRLALDAMRATDGFGSTGRLNLDWKMPGLSLAVASRGTDAGFRSFGGMVDSEGQILQTLTGMQASSASLDWNQIRGVRLRSEYDSWQGLDGLMTERNWNQNILDWQLDRFSALSLRSGFLNQTTVDGLSLDQDIQGVSLSRQVTRDAKVTVTGERETFSGTQEALPPDRQSQSVVVEAKVSAQTQVRTEHGQTSFDNGARETTMSNTVSTALSPRAGVSVTDTRVNRPGDEADASFRDYGFWYDFGKGIKLRYSTKRTTEGELGRLESTFDMGRGEVQGLKLDGAAYNHNRIDERNDTHVGRFSLGSAKPLQWGWLSDVQFRWNSDTQRDRWAWQKENEAFQFSGVRGALAFGFDYNSQIDRTGQRAIDRFFSFNSDRTGKAPLQAAFRYGVRTMPSNENVMIRDYGLKWQLDEKVSLNHSVVTNALQQKGGVLLGTITTPLRTNSWSLNYNRTSDLKAGLFWKENIDENRFLRTREGGISLVLMADKPSPLSLTYGLQQFAGSSENWTAHKFGLSFNQRPGPNQSLSLMLENLQWENGRPSGSALPNWNVRMDYSWRF
ncbi:MAG: hypothetical protein MH204_09530, partial [Fimbriimonadaceae bacterium]|nr:hypothetical protein [Fimbriimonadaceae bacterium]